MTDRDRELKTCYSCARLLVTHHSPAVLLIALVWLSACATEGQQAARSEPTHADRAPPGGAEPRGASLSAASSAETPTAEANASAPPPAAALVPAPCPDLNDTLITEPGTPKTSYSVHGYLGRTLRLRRAEEHDEHCVVVAWPPGNENSAGGRSRVGSKIDAAWFRAIENTFARIPWRHVKVVHRVVIDNQPMLHGLAPFDRNDPTDGRDGHSIWLTEHLFVDRDHWVRANVGSYFSYHTDQPGKKIDGLGPDHHLFSPVLLHEIGHLIMYSLINPEGEEEATPPCAESCGDAEAGCNGLTKLQKEAGCISPYCRPLRFPGSTENWAEQYRFYYQSTLTRSLLTRANSGCLRVLAQHDVWPSNASTWPFSLPNNDEFKASRWDSCGKRACKAW